MTTRKSVRKKTYRFEELTKAVNKIKDSEITKSSDISGTHESTSHTNKSSFQDSFLEFQFKSNKQFSHMEYAFSKITESITESHNFLADLHSRQNKPRNEDLPGISNDMASDKNIDQDDHRDTSGGYPFTLSSTNNKPQPLLIIIMILLQQAMLHHHPWYQRDITNFGK